MRRRTVLTAGLLAGPLAACGDAAADGDRVFRQFDPADQASGLVTAVETWNDSHPDYRVSLETLSPSNPQQFAREANAGSGPDIVQLGFVDVAFMSEPRILLPLDDLMAASPLDGAQTLLATDMVTYDGATWAVPWTADTMALVYRPDVLEDAGMTRAPEDWEELAEMSSAITRDSAGEISGFLFPAGAQHSSAQWFPINYYLWAHGAQLISRDGGTWTVGVDAGELTATIEYFERFFTQGITPVAMQAITDYGDPSIVGRLDAGTAAMTFMPPAAFRAAQESTGQALRTAPMPSGLQDGATHLGGRALGINAHCEEPEAAWEFVKFLLSPRTFETYPQYPASAETLTQVDIDPSEQGFVDQLPHAESFARYADAPMAIAALQELVNQQFSAVYSGQSSADDAAMRIISSIEEGLAG